MVEGPGATRNGKKTKSLINRRIVSVQSNCSSKVCSSNDEDSNQPWFIDRYLADVFSIGKELYLIFARYRQSSRSLNETHADSRNDDLAIRLHFGMNGSLIVKNLDTEIKENKSIQKDTPTLCLTFGSLVQTETHEELQNVSPDTKMIVTYQTTVTGPIPANIPRQKFLNFSNLDVCSYSFSEKSVLEKIRKETNKERSISDVLLDQNIFPGVGNIIKVEGLHAASIHPKQTASSIHDDQLLVLIDSCRNYAMKWLQNGHAPSKSVYNKSTCSSCKQQTISMQRVGGSQRTTFWCIQCQPLQLPTRDDNLYPNLPSGEKITTRTNHQQQVISKINSAQRVCPTHGPDKLVLRRARKGLNTSRIFLCCKATHCNYFMWADTHFPKCSCKKRAILLISKTERSGGKWFFACNNKESKCKYFAWAQQKDLASLGNTLTPLL